VVKKKEVHCYMVDILGGDDDGAVVDGCDASGVDDDVSGVDVGVADRQSGRCDVAADDSL
jgi:hypothetical protein